MRAFYESALWITQSFFSRNPDFHHGLLRLDRDLRLLATNPSECYATIDFLEGDSARKVYARGWSFLTLEFHV